MRRVRDSSECYQGLLAQRKLYRDTEKIFTRSGDSVSPLFDDDVSIKVKRSSGEMYYLFAFIIRRDNDEQLDCKMRTATSNTRERGFCRIAPDVQMQQRGRLRKASSEPKVQSRSHQV